MAESKHKVTKGLVYHVVTGEPMYVTGIEEQDGTEVAIVNRGVMKQDGMVYETHTFPLNMLETSYSRTKREVSRQVEAETLFMDLRERADAKRYALTADQKNAIAAATAPNKLKDLN